jgi:hypothetical protein
MTGTRVGDGHLLVRVTVSLERHAVAVFVLAASASSLLILGLGLGLTFFSDEWAFIERRALGDPSTWLAPHNEHWSTIPIIAYRGLVETVGLRSYVPYLAVLLALHVACATLVFILLRRSSGPIVALGGSLVVLVFGSGFENLYWGFQIGFVGSMVLGLAMLAILDGPATSRGIAAVVTLLVANLMTSGVGLTFLVIAAMEMSLRPGWRRAIPLLAIPAGAYVAWYLGFGSMGIETHRDPFTIASVLEVPSFVGAGIVWMLGSITGLTGPLAIVVAAGVSVVAARRRRSIPARALAVGAGIVVQYALIALVRAGVTEGQVGYSRYTYLTGILAVVALGALIGRQRLPASGPSRAFVVAASAAVLVLALGLNLTLLVQGRELFRERAITTRALVSVALGPVLPPGVDPSRSLILVPSPESLRRVVATYGSPLDDVLAPWSVEPVSEAALEAARRRAVDPGP